VSYTPTTVCEVMECWARTLCDKLDATNATLKVMCELLEKIAKEKKETVL
jgi:hypothetical protein